MKSIRELWHNFQQPNIHAIGVPKEKERGKQKNNF